MATTAAQTYYYYFCCRFNMNPLTLQKSLIMALDIFEGAFPRQKIAMDTQLPFVFLKIPSTNISNQFNTVKPVLTSMCINWNLTCVNWPDIGGGGSGGRRACMRQLPPPPNTLCCLCSTSRCRQSPSSSPPPALYPAENPCLRYLGFLYYRHAAFPTHAG